VFLLLRAPFLSTHYVIIAIPRKEQTLPGRNRTKVQYQEVRTGEACVKHASGIREISTIPEQNCGSRFCNVVCYSVYTENDPVVTQKSRAYEYSIVPYHTSFTLVVFHHHDGEHSSPALFSQISVSSWQYFGTVVSLVDFEAVQVFFITKYGG